MTPLGSRVVPEVNAISAGIGGVGGDGARHRLVGEQVVESSAPTRADDRHVRAQIGLKRHPAELLGGDEHLRPGRGQDVADLLAAVEVHDRHDHRAEECRRPERRGGLHPVRQLDGDHVARPDAARAQPRGQPAGLDLDVARTCRRTAARAECTWNAASGLAARPPANRSPRVSCVHHPSARTVWSAQPGMFRMDSASRAPPTLRVGDAILR